MAKLRYRTLRENVVDEIRMKILFPQYFFSLFLFYNLKTGNMNRECES